MCERGINGEICSGPTHGECTCDGACRCLIEPVTGMPYNRSDCSCTPNNQVCIDPTNATVSALNVYMGSEPETVCIGTI